MDKYNEQAKKCIDEMIKLYTYDSITLLDCVLTDDLNDPQYSSHTAYKRLKNIVIYEKECLSKDIDDVFSWMKINGYSEEDVKVLQEKMQKEEYYG